MKNQLKKLYYRIHSPVLKPGYRLSLGFVFHTERIYHTAVFKALLDFCIHYKDITGKRPLCTVISPTNRRLNNEMNQVGFSMGNFKGRLEELSLHADIGYHGHFWRTENDFDNSTNQVRALGYSPQDEELIQKQFKQDYSWLCDHPFTLPYYAAGWWFMNNSMVKKLIEENIEADFSYSMLRWISNPYFKTFFKEHQIRFGEPFRLTSNGKSITCIQTLMGCPNSPFSEDIIRQLNTYFDGYQSPMGMLATHDYNLIEGNNLEYNKQMICYLSRLKNVSLHSAEELVSQGNKVPLKEI